MSEERKDNPFVYPHAEASYPTNPGRTLATSPSSHLVPPPPPLRVTRREGLHAHHRPSLEKKTGEKPLKITAAKVGFDFDSLVALMKKLPHGEDEVDIKVLCRIVTTCLASAQIDMAELMEQAKQRQIQIGIKASELSCHIEKMEAQIRQKSDHLKTLQKQQEDIEFLLHQLGESVSEKRASRNAK